MKYREREKRVLDTPEAKQIFKACHRFLTHDYPKTPRQVLSELAETTDPELEADRYGQGDLILYPFVLSAQKGLRERLGRMEAYHAKAKEIAALLAPFSQIGIVPNPPQTNMMHLFIGGERDTLEAAALDVAQETGTWLFYRLAPALLPGFTMFELTVGEATLDLSGKEIVALFQPLLSRVNA